MLTQHYTLLGDAARAVKFEDYTPFPKVEVGILTSRMTPEVKQSLREWKYVDTEDGWTQTFMNVPIVFKEIKRKYKFLENPDTRFFDVDEFKLPNPWSKYWESRHLVQ